MNALVEPGAGRHARPAPSVDARVVRKRLCDILAKGVDVHRCLAAKALGRIGGDDARKSLIAALLDEDEDVRTDAAEALCELADPASREQLLENLLGDPCMEVKLFAIRTLAKLQDVEVVPWLRRIVRGRDEEIVWDEQELRESGWDDWMEVQKVSIDALGDLRAAEAVPDIIDAIRDENAQDITEIAFKALSRMGREGIEALAEFLDRDEPVRLRRRAAAAIAGVTDEDVAAPLGRALSDASAQVRAAAMRARAAAAPDEAGLERFLEDPSPDVRAEAAGLFGHRVPDRLIVMLDDESGAVQAAALAALTGIADRLDDDAVIEKVRPLLSSGNAMVAASATGTLAATAHQDALKGLVELLGDTERSTDVRLAALRGLASIGGPSVTTALVRFIDDDVRIIRLEVMSSLARFARSDADWPNAAGEALLEALRGRYTPEPEKQPSAETTSITEQPAPEPEPDSADADPDAYPTSTLNAILEDDLGLRRTAGLPDQGFELTPSDMERLALAKRIVGKKRVALEPTVVMHEDIRRFAARVLGDLHRADVAEELAEMLSSPDADLRISAADSLTRITAAPGSLPDRAREHVLAALPSADRDLKVLLVRALGASEGIEVGEALKAQLADEDGFVRTEAIRALFRLGQTGSETEAMLNDPDSPTRLAAAEAVAGAANDGSVALLVDYAFSHEGLHRREAARLLRNLDPATANAAFLGVLQNSERKRFWAVAIEALEELNGA